MTALPHFKSRRAAERIGVTHSAILHCGAVQIPAVLDDITIDGARISVHESRADQPFDGALGLELPGLGRIDAVIAWRDGHRIGLAFEIPSFRKGTLKTQIDVLIANRRR